MSLTEGILIVFIVIIMIYSLRRPVGDRKMRQFDCVDRATGEVTSVKMDYRSDPEKATQKDNAEYFSVCGDSTDIQKQLSCYCEDSTGQFANDAYGGPGLDYKDYVMAQGIDYEVVKNHAEFVKDRGQGGPVNWTGRTYSMPDEIETEFMPKAWMGIRGRPQDVEVCNPTQVTDPTSTQFSKTQKLVWTSV